MVSADEKRPRFEPLAAECLEALREGAPWQAAADRLARAACAPATELEASRALFSGVVEPLADSFEPREVPLYQEFFGRVLAVARRAPGFEQVQEALDATPRRCEPAGFDPAQVRRIVVLSRVTFGADIAVTSVFLRAALDLPRRPQVLFAAGPKNLELFAGEPGLQGVELRYPRGGSLRDRLAIWLDAKAAIAEVAADLAPGELLVLDPDSRMTQLGLLPVAPAGQPYLFFDSRSCRDGEPGPLGALAAEWLEDRLGGGERAPLPWIAPPAKLAARAAEVRRSLDGPLATLNFGVGGNQAKRLADPFEPEAARELAARGYRLAIDAGAGEEEARRAGDLLACLPANRAMLHEGSFASFAALIGVSDLFVGYDSGAAHAAAALGVRAIDIFAGAPNELMRSRWSPWGKRPALVVAVDAGEEPANVLWRLRELLP